VKSTDCTAFGKEKRKKLLKEIFHSWAIPDLDTFEEHRSHALGSGFISFESKEM